MNKSIYKNNYLIVGSSSNIALRYISLLGKSENNFYGLSRKINEDSKKYFNKIVTYENLDQYSDIKFSHILIIASRNPSDGGSLNDFLSVNNLVIESLNSIQYSQNLRPKLTFLSSFSVYDKNASYIDDATLLKPSDNYGESKILLEESLKEISKESGGDLLICRLPVFLYQGVNKASSNFLAKLSLAINSKSTFSLTNPNAFLGAVFDVDNLVNLDSKKIHELKIVNCSSKPDITFKEIGKLAIDLGLKGVDWQQSDRPSVELCLKTINEILGFEPSAKKIIENWLPKELR